jgi:hypothetical protein
MYMCELLQPGRVKIFCFPFFFTKKKKRNGRVCVCAEREDHGNVPTCVSNLVQLAPTAPFPTAFLFDFPVGAESIALER